MNIKPDRDEIDSFHRKRGQGRLSERIGDVPPGGPSGGGGGGGGGALTGLLVLLVLGLGGVCYYLYDQLGWAQTQIKADQQRILRMEKQLMITDESLDESASAIEKKIRFLDSEVRKLWDNVWKKTKDDLAEHDKRLASLEKNLKGSESQLTQFRQQISADRRQLESLQETLAQIESRTASNTAGLKKLQQSGDVKAQIAALEKRVTANEEWVESVNAFRRQVNRDISSLRETISRYHGGSGTGGSSGAAAP